jgi:outer membrane lipopolysaccharide assembly protein LptE/RlpB
VIEVRITSPHLPISPSPHLPISPSPHLPKIYMKRILFVLLTCIGLFWLSGCGYTLVGRGSLPKHIKTIAIPVFENETLEEGIEEVITQAIIDVYVRGGKVRLVSETEADAILRGKVRSYNPDEALTYNDLDEVLSYKLTVTVDIEMQGITNDEILWQQENLSEDADFEAGPDFSLAERQDNEEEALEQLAEELAQRILALSTEGF